MGGRAGGAVAGDDAVDVVEHEHLQHGYIRVDYMYVYISETTTDIVDYILVRVVEHEHLQHGEGDTASSKIDAVLT